MSTRRPDGNPLLGRGYTGGTTFSQTTATRTPRGQSYGGTSTSGEADSRTIAIGETERALRNFAPLYKQTLGDRVDTEIAWMQLKRSWF